MESMLAEFGLENQTWVNLITGLVIFGVALLLATLSHYVVIPIAQRLSRHTETELDDQIFRAVRRPVSALILVLGGYVAIVVPTNLTPGQQNVIDSVFVAAGIMAFILLIGRVLAVTLDWYIARMPAAQTGTGAHLIPMLRKLAVMAVYAIGALLALEALGISVSPLIAGLGLGGLAVALAIQPTLSNVFAGTYVMTEGVISPGDYIELQGGVAGYVLEVSWRSTRIRTWENNLIVIPNARFAETIFTNYSGPDKPVNVFLTCRVSYSSDLLRVEAISIDVMKRVLETSPFGVKEYGEYFGFDNFGESNVDFWLFLQAKDRLASFELRSELVRELHKRFDEEGIVINYPVRALQFPSDVQPPSDGRSFPTPVVVHRRPAADTPSPDIAAPDGPS